MMKVRVFFTLCFVGRRGVHQVHRKPHDYLTFSPGARYANGAHTRPNISSYSEVKRDPQMKSNWRVNSAIVLVKIQAIPSLIFLNLF